MPVRAAAQQYWKKEPAAPKHRQDSPTRAVPRVMTARSPSRAHSWLTVSREARVKRLRTVVIQEPWALVKPLRRMSSGW